MRKSIPLFSSLKLLLACSVAGFATVTASAQVLTLLSPTVNDGGFESTSAKGNFTADPSAITNTIPNWGATLVTSAGVAVGAPNNSGAELVAPSAGADNNATYQGAAGSFYQPGASTAYNLITTRTVRAGDVYTLSWFGRFTGAGGQQVLTLFTQSPANTSSTTSYTYTPTATLLTADGAANATYALGRTYAQYSVTYAAAPGDVGNYIGLTYGNSGNAFTTADDFTLTVRAVPEPSVYAFLAVGLSGLWLAGRMRRAVHA